MIDFSLTPEQTEFLKTIDKFGRKELEPVAREVDAAPDSPFPWDTVAQGLDLGLTRLAIPEQYGGLGLDLVTTALIVSRVAYYDSGFADVFGATALGFLPLLLGGGEDQKEYWFKRTCADETGRLLWAFACTEPNSGSDSFMAQDPQHGTRTTAVRDGDFWVVNGRKCFITNGGQASMFTLLARTDPALGQDGGTSWFVHEAGLPGFSVGKFEKKMGHRVSSVTELIYEDVRLPGEAVIGDVGDGQLITENVLAASDPMVGLLSAAVAERATDLAVDYAQQRIQGGRPIIEHQLVQRKLVNMRTRALAARYLCLKALWTLDNYPPGDISLGIYAKVFGSDTAVENAMEAMDVAGGYGYMQDYPFEKLLRDARLNTIYEGSNDLLRHVAGQRLTEEQNDYV